MTDLEEIIIEETERIVLFGLITNAKNKKGLLNE
jgi:hypothetical protein